MSENEVSVNLIASTLTNSFGTTVIGHTNEPNLKIQVTYADGQTDQTKSDENGDFIYRMDPDFGGPSIQVSAYKNDQLIETVTAAIEMPAPVVTGVISTRDGQRFLEGRVNQPDTQVSMTLNDEHIDVVVDDNQEFEMLIPDDVTSEQIQLACVNEKTKKTGKSAVQLGVTSKTQAVPILTDAIIDEYRTAQNAQADGRTTQAKTDASQDAVKVEAVKPATRGDKEKKAGFFSRVFGKLFG